MAPSISHPDVFLGQPFKYRNLYQSMRKAPPEADVINWASGVGIGGIPVVSGEACEYPSLRFNDGPPWVKEVKSLHRLISFFEFLGNCLGINMRQLVCVVQILCGWESQLSRITDEMISFWGNITQRAAPPLGCYKKCMSVILPTTPNHSKGGSGNRPILKSLPA